MIVKTHFSGHSVCKNNRYRLSVAIGTVLTDAGTVRPHNLRHDVGFLAGGGRQFLRVDNPSGVYLYVQNIDLLPSGIRRLLARKQER